MPETERLQRFDEAIYSTLELELTDSEGNPLDDEVDIELSGSVTYASRVRVYQLAVLRSLPAGGVSVAVKPTHFFPQTAQATLGSLETRRLTLSFRLRPAGIGGFRAAPYHKLDLRVRNILDKSRIRGGKGVLKGAGLYESLNRDLKATFLNVCAKAASSKLSSGVSYLNLFDEVKAFEPDRIVFAGSPEIGGMVAGEAGFRPTSRGGARMARRFTAGKLKTNDQRGALRLNLYGAPSKQKKVLIDASLAGIREPVEMTYKGTAGAPAVRTTFSTNPYLVGELLKEHHQVSPQYELLRKRERAAPASRDPVVIDIRGDFASAAPDPLLPESAPETTRGVESITGDEIVLTEPQTKPAGGDPLRVSHWIENEAGETRKMSDPLAAGRPHLYWFEIAEVARESASIDEFIEPAVLKVQPESTMRVEVISELLASGAVRETRTVKYRRGKGIAPVSFDLLAKPGEHDLLVNVLHQENRVYSRSWPMKAEGSPDLGAGSPPPLEDSPGTVLLTQVESYFSLRAPGGAPIDKCGLSEGGFTSLTLKARQILRKFADQYPLNESEGIDQKGVLTLLSDMAKWGYDAYRTLFPPKGKLKPILDRLPSGAGIDVDSDHACFPWEWLYMGRPPASPDRLTSAEAIREVLGNFWGYRFRIWLIVRPADWVLSSDEIENASQTRMLSAVNPETDKKGGPQNLEYVEKLRDQYGIANRICTNREAAMAALQTGLGPQDSPHLLYFYCHHQPGKQLTGSEYSGFGDSTLFMKKEKEEPITRWDLLDLELPPFPRDNAPIVFLNACGTAQGQEFYPAGFIPYFATEMNARAVIGTQAEVNTVAAWQFARDLLDAWFKGSPLADALLGVRRAWLKPDKLNPYAMYYSIYGDGRVRLGKRIK
ncbi:MAG: CHAT domain-containing protein [Bryobacteraceae bacterium]|nr:CHAT domain-containing protein [Bryobacteraceae bacterium]